MAYELSDGKLIKLNCVNKNKKTQLNLFHTPIK